MSRMSGREEEVEETCTRRHRRLVLRKQNHFNTIRFNLISHPLLDKLRVDDVKGWSCHKAQG